MESRIGELTAAPKGRPVGGNGRLPRGRLLAVAAWALCVAALPACGGSGSDAPAPPAAPRAWIVLGSSTAAGVGASPGQSWASQLDVALRGSGDKVENRARSGATTYEALPATTARPAGRPPTLPAQDVALALESKPRVLVLAFPSNDALLGYSVAETTANLRLMRDLARARSVGVVLLSTQPRDDAGPTANATMLATDTAMAAELGGCFVPVRAALSDASGRIAPAFAAGDGIHLNDAGHRLVYDRLWAAVRSGGGCVIPP